MNPLTAIRKAINELKFAYDNAQRDEEKRVEAETNCLAAINLIQISIREMRRSQVLHSMECLESGEDSCIPECPKFKTKKDCVACGASSENIQRGMFKEQSHCLDARECANRQQF